MKVLHIGKYYPPYFGGIEKVNFDLVEGLNEAGVETDVICFNNTYRTEVKKEGYSIFRMSRITEIYSVPFSLSYYIKLRCIIKNYHIVHIHLPNPTAAIFLLLTNYKGRIILHWHSDIVKQKFLKNIYLPFDNILKRKAKIIIVTSKKYLDSSKDLSNFKKKCKVIPIGIDSSELVSDNSFFKLLKNEYKGRKIIFSLGRLTYYKGFDYLIDATKELNDDTLVLIGGTGELYSVLENQIKNSDLQNKIKLLGKIPLKHLHSYFKLADIFCLPSVHKSEAFGVVLIEAMSLGCPQVVFNIKGSGVPWVVENEKTGLVIDSINSKLLAKKLNYLLSNDQLLEYFSNQSIQRYNVLFTKQDMINETLKIYNNIYEKYIR
jgi:glycosyltransferase involved in cell wall biosynthesis